MVFSTIPVYLDPSNWHQQGIEQQGINIANNDSFHLSPPQPPPLPTSGIGCGPGLIRPGSMVDRARLARLPLPEAGLNCPRCESTNTKFCYFNNYSLSQPRHFCKTCRRYWTRGGALRNVPVGGGCRRNKRSKATSNTGGVGGRSKSPITLQRRAATTGSGFSGSTSAVKNLGASLLPPPTQLPFLPTLQGLNDHVTGDFGGLNLGAVPPPVATVGSGGGSGGEMEFQMGASSSAGVSRMQNFPLITGLDSTPGGLYPFHHDSDHQGVVEPLMGTDSGGQLDNSGLSSMVRVKNEDSSQLGLNLSKNLLGIQGSGADDGQYNSWSGAAGNEWTDLSVFSSSSTSHLL